MWGTMQSPRSQNYPRIYEYAAWIDDKPTGNHAFLILFRIVKYIIDDYGNKLQTERQNKTIVDHHSAVQQSAANITF